MNKFVKYAALTGLTFGLGGIATSTTASAKTPWEFKYHHEYKVRVVRPTPVYKIKYGHYGYQNARVKKFYLKRGEVVRTWYRGLSGFDWVLTGGTHEKYSRNYHYGYDAEWASRKSFKILHVYKGTDWF